MIFLLRSFMEELDELKKEDEKGEEDEIQKEASSD